MISGPVADEAIRLASLVARLDRPAWIGDLTRLMGDGREAGAGESTPRYGEVARSGTRLVSALADRAMWDEAAIQARHLKRFFGVTGTSLGPIAEQTFDGLLAACLAREPEELQDFVELIAEMFP